MKILIGCDELSSADKLHYDLKRAGLPDVVDVCVLSVADVFVPPGYKMAAKHKRTADQDYLAHVDEELRKAQHLAQTLIHHLKSKFPFWNFHAESAAGSVAAEIIHKAVGWQADLIVVGSHGKPGFGQFFVGSIAVKILAGAPCSVRIVRNPVRELDSSSRIVVGVDGSAESDAAIRLLTKRHWKKGSAVHLVTAINTVIYTAFLSEGLYVDPVVTAVITPDDTLIKNTWRSRSKKPKAWIKRMHEEYESKLKETGLIVSSMIKEDDPKTVLIEEAERWGAESVFVGAVGHSMVDRFLIGSVSTAVASRAPCSVEVIRMDKTKL